VGAPAKQECKSVLLSKKDKKKITFWAVIVLKYWKIAHIHKSIEAQAAESFNLIFLTFPHICDNRCSRVIGAQWRWQSILSSGLFPLCEEANTVLQSVHTSHQGVLASGLGLSWNMAVWHNNRTTLGKLFRWWLLKGTSHFMDALMQYELRQSNRLGSHLLSNYCSCIDKTLAQGSLKEWPTYNSN